jgi:hypothetical protein
MLAHAREIPISAATWAMGRVWHRFTSCLRPSTLRGAFAWGLVVLSKSDEGRRDTYRTRLPHCGLSAPRCDADTVPVRIGCEEGQPEPRIMRLLQDRDALGIPLLEDRVDLVGPTVDGQAHLTGTRDVR